MPIEKTTVQPFIAGQRAGEKRIAARLLKECRALGYDLQQDEWKGQIARDLNTLLGRAEYFLETDKDESDIAAAEATLRIVARVEEFEGIRRVK